MKHVIHSRYESIEVLTLARPPANALDIEMTEEIADAFEGLAREGAASAAILTGEGKAFCAGLDLKAIPRYGEAELQRLLHAINRMATTAYACPIPVIGAINGHAIAGGFVLAMCCDWKIVADTPLQAGLTEVRVGVPYPAAALQVVRSELDPKVARELVLFGKNMGGAEAIAAGIFDESAPLERLLERAMQKARDAAEAPPHAFKTIKLQLRRPALEACRAAVSGEGEPLRNGWIDPAERNTSSSVLHRNRG
ncbi:MAG TPA: enoyl-CoA hydratase/isomerase family protein [Candidatus Binataceae bacterium]|nr:enoyl-CoA hydratase/isomerase family protein [Candidatus Binataceae bacterium]